MAYKELIYEYVTNTCICPVPTPSGPGLIRHKLYIFPLFSLTERPSYAPPPAPAPTTVSIQYMPIIHMAPPSSKPVL